MNFRMELNRARYGRHISLKAIGEAGQMKLNQSSVLVIGMGGLGCPAALYLAAAGVGRIGLVDDDVVALSNLQRQVLYATPDKGRKKVEVAREKLLALNPEIVVPSHEERFSVANAMNLVQQYDLVIDGTDHFFSRLLINDACVRAKKPLIYGAVYQFDAQISVFDPTGPCYRCLFPRAESLNAELPSLAAANCEEEGVLGVLPGVVGTLQATEALKHLLGLGEPLRGKLLLFDVLRMSFETLAVRKDPGCLACGVAPSSFEELHPTATETAIAAPARTRGTGSWNEITVEQLRNQLRSGVEKPMIYDVRSPEDYHASSIPGAQWLSLSDLEGSFSRISSDQEIVLYCRSGRKSSYVIEQLVELGFKNARHLLGGFEAWVGRD